MQQLGKVLIGLILLLLVAIPAVWSDSAETTNHAAIVVDYGNGSSETACVAFQESTISGYDLLSRSGLTLLVDVQGGLGAAICSIGNVGCPASNCFCDAPNFWRYSYLANNQWQGYQLGASSSTIADGAVDGWAWGQGTEPPVVSFEQICSAEINTPTPSPTATTTLTPSSTPTPTSTPTTAILPTRIVPTATLTPRPTVTPRPTQTPTALPATTETATQTPTETATAAATSTVEADDTATTAANTATPAATNTPPPTSTTAVIVSAENNPDPTATPLPTATPVIVPTSTPRPVTTDNPTETVATAAYTATPSPTPLQQQPTETTVATSALIAQPTDESRVPPGDVPIPADQTDSTLNAVAPTAVSQAVISAETSPTPIAIAVAERQLPTAEPIIFDPPAAGNGAVAARVIGADAQLASAFIPAAIQPAPANPSQLSVMLPYLLFTAIVATLTLLILLAGRNKTRHLSR